MDLISTQLEKARIFTYLGFVGLAMPVVGIVMACIGISILDRLEIEGDEDAEYEKERLRNLAHLAIRLPIILMAIGVVIILISIAQL